MKVWGLGFGARGKGLVLTRKRSPSSDQKAELVANGSLPTPRIPIPQGLSRYSEFSECAAKPGREWKYGYLEHPNPRITIPHGAAVCNTAG